VKNIIGWVLLLAMAGCATCKSSDTVEQCRTKQRDKSQKYSSFVISTPDRRLAAAAGFSPKYEAL
jgi:hypothetical protein